MADGEGLQARSSAPPEALLVCPICQESLPGAVYESHLRQIHRLFSYRGVRRSFDDTVEAMLDDLVTIPPIPVAWPALVRLVRDEHGGGADVFLARQLGAALGRRPAALDKLLPDLASLVSPGNAPLIAALAGDPELVSRRLALAALAVLPPPIDPLLMRPLSALLLDRALPEEAQVQALAAVLPGIQDPLQANDLFEKLIAGLGKTNSFNRLLQLEKRAGPRPSLTALCEKLREQVRMSCPRCGVHMRQPAMMQHLWDEHRLVLDGLRVRDPWGVVEEWLDACKARHDDELLERCRIAASKIAGDEGLIRLQRLTLVHGVADPDARRALLAEAREQHAACCPWCYALVAVPREGAAPFVNHRPGRLSAGGYSVELDDWGLATRLEVRTPGELIYQGHEPGRQLAAGGLSLLISGFLVLSAMLLAFIWPADRRPIGPVLALVVLAWMGYALVRLVWRVRKTSARRVLDYTWRYLVPRLHANGFNLADSAFLAGLARLHSRTGKGDPPAEELMRLVRFTEQAVKRGEAPPGHLAALCRLEIERAVEQEEDPVPLVARWLERCFTGRLPLAFAQQILDDWTTAWWTKGALARLRILLCDRAFEAGFEVRSLLDAGQNAPALGAVLKTDAPLSLAALRLLWSLRATCPWDRLGKVRTAFDLAGDPDRAGDLADHPDVLLWHEDPACVLVAEEGVGRTRAARMQITPAGVWLQDVMFTAPPRECEVRLRSTGAEMILGRHVFRSPGDLDPLSRQLERWFRYGFHDFLPQVERVLTWQSPDRAAILRAWGAVPCPECGRHLLPRVGEVGMALDEASR